MADDLDAQPVDNEAIIEKLQVGRNAILRELRKLIVGQDAVIEQVLIALFTGGHILLTGDTA